jgi:hypothetical protein
VEREEWEAWLEGPVTRKVKALLAEVEQDQLQAKQDLDPKLFEDPHSYYSNSLVLTTRAEAYHAILDSLSVDAYEDIFEEDNAR